MLDHMNGLALFGLRGARVVYVGRRRRRLNTRSECAGLEAFFDGKKFWTCGADMISLANQSIFLRLVCELTKRVRGCWLLCSLLNASKNT